MYCGTFQVGILDIDLCGPSVPRMLSLEGSDVHQCSTGCVTYKLSYKTELKNLDHICSVNKVEDLSL